MKMRRKVAAIGAALVVMLGVCLVGPGDGLAFLCNGAYSTRPCLYSQSTSLSGNPGGHDDPLKLNFDGELFSFPSVGEYSYILELEIPNDSSLEENYNAYLAITSQLSSLGLTLNNSVQSLEDFQASTNGTSTISLAYSYAPPTGSVPEPSTLFLLGLGLAGVVGAEARRRRKNRAG